MSFTAFVATIIIVLFLVTIVMAVGSYGAYKLRERRRPRSAAGEPPDGENVFFERMDASELEARR
jgi:hypothetical protein